MVVRLFNLFRLHLEYLKVGTKTALEYRINFIIEVLTILINDFIWIVFWMMFFSYFDNVNGWRFRDISILWSLVTISAGIASLFFGNAKEITKQIVDGRLDFYLTLPKNILYHLCCSKINYNGLGEIIFGLIIAFIFLPIAKVPLLVLYSTISAFIFLSYVIFYSSFAFFIGNSQNLFNTAYMAIFSFSTYPASIYKGFAKFFMVSIVPAAFYSWKPIELLGKFSYSNLFSFIGFAIIFFIISVSLFYIGLRRYESGNLMYVRN